jgi:hypothetical protein
MPAKNPLPFYDQFVQHIQCCLDQFNLTDYQMTYSIPDDETTYHVHDFIFEYNLYEQVNKIQEHVINELKTGLYNNSEWLKKKMISDKQGFDKTLQKVKNNTPILHTILDEDNITYMRYALKQNNKPETEEDKIKLAYNILKKTVDSIYKKLLELDEKSQLGNHFHSHIFKDLSAFQLFQQLHEEYETISRNHLANYSFIYRQMHKDELIHGSVRDTDFRQWLFKEYEIDIAKTKTLDNCTTNSKKIAYSKAKELVNIRNSTSG